MSFGASCRTVHVSSNNSDIEVLLKAYDRWGEDFVDHLVGMFALVIVDSKPDRVVMARDRLGIKPLYLAALSGRLRFASTAHDSEGLQLRTSGCERAASSRLELYLPLTGGGQDEGARNIGMAAPPCWPASRR